MTLSQPGPHTGRNAGLSIRHTTTRLDGEEIVGSPYRILAVCGEVAERLKAAVC
jgi:hypothetical protein